MQGSETGEASLCSGAKMGGVGHLKGAWKGVAVVSS